MARFLIQKDREVIKHLLTLAGGDLGLVEKVLRESDVPRRGGLAAVGNTARSRGAPKRS